MIKVNDAIPTEARELKGTVRIVQRDKDGNVHSDTSRSNTVVVGIRSPIVRLLGGNNHIVVKYKTTANGAFASVPSGGHVGPVNGDLYISVDYGSLPFIGSIAFGSSGDPATMYDTALKTAIAGGEKLIAMAPTIDSGNLKVTFAAVIGDQELNDVMIREAVLKTTDGTVVARTPIGEHRKIPGMFFEFYWTIGYENT